VQFVDEAVRAEGKISKDADFKTERPDGAFGLAEKRAANRNEFRRKPIAAE